MMDKRKDNRLKGYDYSIPGAYFITICTKDKQHLLSEVVFHDHTIDRVGEGLCALPQTALTEIGQMVESSILFIDEHFPSFVVDKYVIMPNHIHLLVQIHPDNTGGHRGPPLHKIIGQFKSYTTHQYGSVLWQRSFYDHIIRGEEDYRDVWDYIEANPLRWRLDEHYCEKQSVF